MGKKWDSDKGGRDKWIAWLTEGMRECLRVLKPGGMALVWSIPRTAHWTATAIEDAGFEIRDKIYHVFGCLSEDTEILTINGWEHYHKNVASNPVLCYDIAKDEFLFDKPMRSFCYDYEDTAYNIKSDSTNQIVSRNHRCIIEQDGEWVFQRPETWECQKDIPFLENLYSLPETIPNIYEGAGIKKQDLLKKVFRQEILRGKDRKTFRQNNAMGNYSMCGMWKGHRETAKGIKICKTLLLWKKLLQNLVVSKSCNSRTFKTNCIKRTFGLDRRRQNSLSAENEWAKKSRLERWGNILQNTWKLCKRQICALSRGFFTYGTQGWLCYGISLDNGSTSWQMLNTKRDCSPQGSRPNQERIIQSQTFQFKQRTQVVRRTRAEITPIWYKGKMWCVQVSTGAFVARRNGKIFITGNSGFPKSLSIDKAIDKINGEMGRLLKFTAWMRTTELTIQQIDKATGTFMGSHYLTNKSQPAIPTCELWTKLRPLCGAIPFWVDDLVKRIEAEREIIGKHNAPARSIYGDDKSQDVNITISATPEAQRFSGYGTALKPSTEEWVLAMKPLDGNFAENALRHNLAGLNIDGCRIKTEHQEERITKSNKPIYGGSSLSESKTIQTTSRDGSPTGRWPSNLLLSHHELCREIGMKKVKNPSGSVSGKEPSNPALNVYGQYDRKAFDKHSDKDGTETVPAYECAAGCPCGHVWATKELTECPECGCRLTEWVCAVKMLDEQAGPLKSGARKEGGIYQLGRFKHQEGARGLKTSSPCDASSGSASRFFYCSKSSCTEREQGLKGHIPCVKCGGLDTDWHLDEKGEKVKCVRNDHPTRKPLSIMEYLVRLTQTPDGGVVLDPFLGSGTTAVACVKTGRKFIGIEKERNFIEISKWAIEAAGKKYGQQKLFKEDM